MNLVRLPLLALLITLAGAGPARAQEEAPPAGPAITTEPLRLSGPRFGVTYVTGEAARRLEDDLDARPFFTQFGWQFENRLFRVEDSGLTGVTELVPLIGGLEQGLFLPSITFLVGLRTAGGTEFGVGPNVSAAGTGLAVAAGVTQAYGPVSLPVNVSAVLSDQSVRLSLLVGFTVRR